MVFLISILSCCICHRNFSVATTWKMTEKLTISGKNLGSQEYSLPPKYMDYLIENADAEAMQKFHRCCKHLYKVAPYFIVDSFALWPPKYRIENKKYDSCLEFNRDVAKEFLLKINNIWVTKCVHACSWFDELFRKVVRCSVRDIYASDTNLSFDTFKTLTKSGTIEGLTCVRIWHDDRSVLPLEDILSRIPKLDFFALSDVHVTPETMVKLMQIPWKQKFTYFKLNSVDGDLDVELFYEFVKVSYVTEV